MIARVIGVLAVAGLAVACARVLGIRKDVEPVFPHRAHLVAGISCVRCHPGVDQAGDDGPLHIPDDASCTTCHEPHTRGSCAACHSDPFAAAAVIDARAHLRFAHADHVAASRGQCVTCHRGIAGGDGRLRPAMATCFRCHQEERDLRDCDACHVELAEEGTLPESHLVHEGDWLRDHGVHAGASADLCSSCHTESSCAACHGTTTAALPSRLRFDDPDTASVHRAGFFARHGREARGEPGLCSSCHAPSSCEACHRDRGVGDDPVAADLNPHPPGWIGIDNEHGRAARRDPASCASCHGGAGEALCVSCHSVGGIGGSPHPPGWSSRQSLGDQPCRLCHTVL